mmetsp:Transcript_2968/g.5224  ORF Transcript_2968/g.5224 Transcript_2968/m.5224 type:complete len:169 (+) Transcript_2968:97-603(+)
MDQRAQLKYYFDAVDLNRSGSIDANELQQVLYRSGMQLPLSSCASLIKMHDRDRSGTIDFEEYLLMHPFIVSVQQSFASLDTQRRGLLSHQQVQTGLQMNGFILDEPAFRNLMKSFDPDNNGVSSGEFLIIAVYLASAKSVFGAFDRQHSGSVSLSYDQFVYCASLLR